MSKKILSGILAIALMITSLLPMNVNAADWNVKVSNVDYGVDMENTRFVYISNQKSIGSKVGTEYYMTYTVSDIKMDATEHQGVLGTTDPTRLVPFETSGNDGGTYYHDYTANKMLIKGKTYFLKFVVTKDGFDYRVGWAEGNKSRYVEFKNIAGEVKTDLGYFGLFIAGTNMTGSLTKVRCYDKNGNDLGVQVTQGRNATVYKNLVADKKVKHSYQITLQDASNVILSNRKFPTGKKVYMEYKVKSSNSSVFQSGVIHSNTNKAYPFDGLNAILYYRQEFEAEQMGKKENGALLDPGATYIIEFEMTDNGMYVIAQKTKNGVKSYYSFPIVYGSCPLNAKLFSIWFGQGNTSKVNCVLTNFKCYDSNGNNLGVQCNQPCEIIHYGAKEDYAGCQAVYYCDTDETLYALYANQKAKYTEGKTTVDGTYVIDEKTSKIKITVNGKIEEYDYMYEGFQNAEGKKYRRLHTYRVIFVTGTEEVIEEQLLSPETGYLALRPSDPVKEDNAFIGWYTGDGTEYHFDKVVTESITLYGKWEKEATYIQQFVKEYYKGYVPYMAVGFGVLWLVLGGIVGIMILKKRRKKDGKKK